MNIEPSSFLEWGRQLMTHTRDYHDDHGDNDTIVLLLMLMLMLLMMMMIVIIIINIIILASYAVFPMR